MKRKTLLLGGGRGGSSVGIFSCVLGLSGLGCSTTVGTSDRRAWSFGRSVGVDGASVNGRRWAGTSLGT